MSVSRLLPPGPFFGLVHPLQFLLRQEDPLLGGVLGDEHAVVFARQTEVTHIELRRGGDLPVYRGQILLGIQRIDLRRLPP